MPVRDEAQPGVRTYVLDTSVLLADPQAILRFDEHDVVLPVVVITELEAKRTHPELGSFARTALRLLDELRIAPGGLHAPARRRLAAGGTQPYGSRRVAGRSAAWRQRHPDSRSGGQPRS